MSAHRLLQDLLLADKVISDPGDAGTIYPTGDLQHTEVETESAETRTLASPVKAGLRHVVILEDDGGDLTLTVTGGYNNDGDTTITFDDDGDFVEFLSINKDGTYVWRAVAQEGTDAALQDDVVTDSITLGGTAITATASEINQHCDESANVETVTSANVLTAAESGKTFFLDADTEFSSTLPTPAAGLRYTFIVADAPACADYTILASGGANIIKGHVLTSDVTGCCAEDSATGNDRINFEACVALEGDRVDLISDGTSWFARASSAAAGAITFDDVD